MILPRPACAKGDRTDVANLLRDGTFESELLAIADCPINVVCQFLTKLFDLLRRFAPTAELIQRCLVKGQA